MIVKDESPVIRRCLASVKPWIDRWVIVDTGSTDGTQDIIRQELADIPGMLVEREWVDFAHNRNEALAIARQENTDYILFLDADEVLRVPEGFTWNTLTEDAYFLTAEYGDVTYSRLLLIATRLNWQWNGVLHEYLTSATEAKKAHLEWPRVVVHHDGARSRDPNTYRKDIELLKGALKADPGNARYRFYLAQSWRDCGDLEKALIAYRHRAAMPGWSEETFYAVYQAGCVAQQLGCAADIVRAAYLAAYQFRPTRAEPLYQLARYHRFRQEWELAYLFARQAVDIARPDDMLFVDDSVYHWRCLDELAVAASHVGEDAQGLAATTALLERSLPGSEMARVTANHEFFVSRSSCTPSAS
jgi:hypothetical protein